MIQVEALETIKSDGLIVYMGDRITLADDLARRWCAAGWAKAVKGECATGERRVVKAVLEPHSGVISHHGKEVASG